MPRSECLQFPKLLGIIDLMRQRVIELENTQNNALEKLPMLKFGEYEMWEIRIKQYFQIQDYALWEVIENGNSWVPIPVTATETGLSTGLKMTVLSTAEEKICKKNDVKARSLLHMALPNEHQLTFDQYVDAQSMFAAIKARFGGNEATKKTQKALLKQQYENFNASSSESLDSIFNRLQKLVSRLAILGVVTPPEDLNVKFLRSLPSEWDTHVVVWMNKPDFDTMGLDDLYNNFKIVEQKKSVLVSQLVHEDLEQLHDDDLEEMDLKWNLGTTKHEGKKNVSTAIKWYILPENAEHQGVKTTEIGIKMMLDLIGDMAEEEIQANVALMAFSDSKVTNDKSCSKSCLKNYEALKKQYDYLLVKLDDTGFKASTYKRGLSILEGQILKYKEHEVLFSEEIALLKRSVGHKEYQMGLLRTKLEKVKEEKEGFEFKIAKFEKSAKDLDQLLASQITDKSKKGFGYNVVPSPHPLILNRPTPLDLSYSGLEEFKEHEVNEYGPRDSSLKPTTGCDKESDNSKENTDDSLKQQQKTDSKTSSVKEEEPKKARENNDAPIIEDWVSDDEDEVEPIPKVEKKTVIPTATKKEFVKPEKPVRRSVRPVNIVRSVNTGRPFSTARKCRVLSSHRFPKSKSHLLCPLKEARYLHTLFEPDEEDKIWKNQDEYNVISWSLYDFCGIHILLMQNGIAIRMLTEKKYPLSQEMISKMLKKKLEVDHESSQAFELLRFIRSQVQK
ncbi:hypothetical protein Tco_1410848 [Tanacetum coccineum]